ncbi:MAG: hypothetical protein ACHQ1H_04880, partial [Nitrososphaerales archaeon]
RMKKESELSYFCVLNGGKEKFIDLLCHFSPVRAAVQFCVPFSLKRALLSLSVMSEFFFFVCNRVKKFTGELISYCVAKEELNRSSALRESCKTRA